MIELARAGLEDLIELHSIQRRSFAALLDKYRDYDTSPGAESKELLKEKLDSAERDYYFIREAGRNIGLVCVKRRDEHLEVCPICLLPEYQGGGRGRAAMALAEVLYPDNKDWELDTIMEEPRLCRFYESLGYRKSGRLTFVQDGMTIVGYKKERGC